MEALDERIGRLDDLVKRLVRGDPVAQRLQTWPGIGVFGPVLAPASLRSIASRRTARVYHHFHQSR